MENANKALIMAASTLLAVMLFAVVVFFFKNLSAIPETEDAILTTEQKANFNAEYEVYKKSAMYGVDVISCLNKAKSFNEKYAEGGSFLNADAYGNEYYIDVYVRLKSCLEEKVTIYYYDVNGKEVAYYGELQDGSIKKSENGTTKTYYFLMRKPEFAGYSSDDLNLGFDGPFYGEEGAYTKFPGGNTSISSFSNKLEGNDFMKVDGGAATYDERKYYSLRDDSQLQNILKYSGNNMKQTTKNKNSATWNVWSSAEWETALYDFKKKRFTCDYINYNGETGLINELWFSEI